MLSETPTNNAVNFVTGAGGFLQQVIFGYTGLRFGTQGIEPAFDPVLPSSVSRLVLRGIWLKGRRYDVVVDGARTAHRALARGSRPMIVARAPARSLVQAPAQAGPVPPVLAFPEPGVDDPAAYQRLPDPVLPRFPAQHGADLPRAAGGADDAGLGRRGQRERRASPRATRVGGRRRSPGTATDAPVSDSAGFRSIEYGLAAQAPSVKLGWFVLGSMRVERDLVYARRHLQPFTAPAFLVAEESLLVAAVRRLPVAEQQAHLALLRARTLASSRPVSVPPSPPRRATAVDRAPGRVRRSTPERRWCWSCAGVRGRSAARAGDRSVTIRSRTGRPVRFRVRVAHQRRAAHSAVAGRDLQPRVPRVPGPSRRTRPASDAARRARRLEREVLGVELLSSREKLMAGLPNFATYFGRDRMMTALMMRAIWRRRWRST